MNQIEKIVQNMRRIGGKVGYIPLHLRRKLLKDANYLEDKELKGITSREANIIREYCRLYEEGTLNAKDALLVIIDTLGAHK